jgi:hypothetical protein
MQALYVRSILLLVVLASVAAFFGAADGDSIIWGSCGRRPPGRPAGCGSSRRIRALIQAFARF